jgi:DNA polymerase
MKPVPAGSPPEKLRDWLRYYEDIGIGLFYMDRTANLKRSAKTSAAVEHITTQPQAANATKPAELPVVRVESQQAMDLPGAVGPSLFEAAERIMDDTLEKISADLGECTRCKLHRGRTNIVFGVGNPHAELMFIGEGPGHDEDIQGLPFVGRAGKLLTQMIQAMGLRREDVYIANVVKCRPPENRAPEKDEVATCMPYLLRQIGAISPKVIVCLGSVAAQALLGTNKGVSRFRGQWLDFRGTKLMPTYHPAYLLRNPHAKPEVWGDLKKVMAFLGLEPPRSRKSAR